MANLSVDSVVAWSTGQLTGEIDSSVILLSIESGKYFGLNPIAQEIWRAIERPTRVADLVERLAKAYDADTETISRDVLALIAKLVQHGLVAVTD